MVEIFPYKSVGPIQFGMDAIQVHSALGQPWANDKNGSGDQVLHFQGLVVTIAPTGVVEVGLLPETPSSFAGIIFSLRHRHFRSFAGWMARQENI